MPDKQQRPKQILVVGAGPVGLVAALSASRLGTEVAVLDAGPKRTPRGHATLLHASSVRLLEELGAAHRFVARAHRVDRLAVYADDRRVATVDFAAPVLSVHQSVVEEALQAELSAQGVEISRACEATTLSERGDHVDVRVVRSELVGAPGGGPEAWQPVSSSVLETDFVIGADGRESRVRSALGIDLVALGAATPYAMFELLPGEPPGSEMILAFADGLASMRIPLPGGRVRWGFELATVTTEELRAADLSMLLARRAPSCLEDVERLDWATVVRFDRRLARRFGRGRAWLAGDAAHGTSPFGAQSMNGGLLEAQDLASRIAGSTSPSDHVASLEDYGAVTASRWQKLLGFNASFDVLPHAHPSLRAVVRGLVPALPALGSELESLLEELGVVVR